MENAAPRGALVCLLLASLVVAGWVLPTRSRARQGDARVELELASQPMWRRSGNQNLGVAVRVANRGVEDLGGLQLRLVVGNRLESRSALDEALEDPDSYLLFQNSAYTPVEDLEVPSDEKRTVHIDDPVSRLDTLATADENGVYPLAVVLADELGRPLDVVTTPFVYYPERLERGLNFVLVVPLSAAPARSPGGGFPVDSEAGTGPLEEALDAGGWLAEMVSALAATPTLRVAVAPEPRLVEEVADMADGYRRVGPEDTSEVAGDEAGAADADAFLQALRDVLANSNVQPLFVPYAGPDLPAITEKLPLDDNLAAHFQQGVAVLRSTEQLGEVVAGRFDPSWLYPAAGRLDAGALEALQSLSPTDARFKTFFSPDSLDQPADAPPPGCPRSFTSFTCAIQTDTPEPAFGFVADAGLQERVEALGEADGRALALQRFVAETAMIREELPSSARRVAHVALPDAWRPPAGLMRRLLSGLARAPWLNPVKPSQALRTSGEPKPKDIVDAAARSANEPTDDFYTDLLGAARVLDYFFAVEPPPSLAQALLRDSLAAQSRAWWQDSTALQRGRSFATESAQAARAHLDRIRIGGRQSLTLTSRQQPIPLVLFNGNDFEVDVEVHLNAFGQLDFHREPTFDVTDMQPGNHPIVVEATARSSGRIPLSVCVAPPERDCAAEPIATAEIAINSTDFNKIALGVTLGALAFLVAFYALRALRRRNRPGDGSSGAATA
jgi:hypothetical protein